MPVTEVLLGFKMEYDSKASLDEALESLASNLASKTFGKVEIVYLDRDIVFQNLVNPSLYPILSLEEITK